MPDEIPQIPEFSGPLPTQADLSNYEANSNRYMLELPGVIAAQNAQAAFLNAMASAVAAFDALVGYRGEWSLLTGALSRPASVSYGGQIYALTVNVVDVTAHTPGVAAAWQLIRANSTQITHGGGTVDSALSARALLSGAEFTGPVQVPGGATGEEVPQAQEVQWSSVAVISAAGTSVDVTGIPADAEEVYIGLSNIAHPATASVDIRLGDSAGVFPVAGYSFASSAVVGPSTIGISAEFTKIPIRLGAASAGVANGGLHLSKLRNTGEWAAVGTVWSTSDTRVAFVSGRCNLGVSFAFDRLRFLCGAGSFSGGEILIKWRRS